MLHSKSKMLDQNKTQINLAYNSAPEYVESPKEKLPWELRMIAYLSFVSSVMVLPLLMILFMFMPIAGLFVAPIFFVLFIIVGQSLLKKRNWSRVFLIVLSSVLLSQYFNFGIVSVFPQLYGFNPSWHMIDIIDVGVFLMGAVLPSIFLLYLVFNKKIRTVFSLGQISSLTIILAILLVLIVLKDSYETYLRYNPSIQSAIDYSRSEWVVNLI